MERTLSWTALCSKVALLLLKTTGQSWDGSWLARTHKLNYYRSTNALWLINSAKSKPARSRSESSSWMVQFISANAPLEYAQQQNSRHKICRFLTNYCSSKTSLSCQKKPFRRARLRRLNGCDPVRRRNKANRTSIPSSNRKVSKSNGCSSWSMARSKICATDPQLKVPIQAIRRPKRVARKTN